MYFQKMIINIFHHPYLDSNITLQSNIDYEKKNFNIDLSQNKNLLFHISEFLRFEQSANYNMLSNYQWNSIIRFLSEIWEVPIELKHFVSSSSSKIIHLNISVKRSENELKFF